MTKQQNKETERELVLNQDGIRLNWLITQIKDGVVLEDKQRAEVSMLFRTHVLSRSEYYRELTDDEAAEEIPVVFE